MGGVTIAGLSGSGTVDLGGNSLTVGSSTSAGAGAAFRGVIQDGGANGGAGGNIIVSGAQFSMQFLTGANTYTGATMIEGGTLLIGSLSALGSQGINGVSLSDSNGGGRFGFTSGANGASNTISRAWTFAAGTTSGFTAVGATDTLTIKGALSGTGDFQTPGIGTAVLTSSNSAVGFAVFNSGTTLITGGAGG